MIAAREGRRGSRRDDVQAAQASQSAAAQPVETATTEAVKTTASTMEAAAAEAVKTTAFTVEATPRKPPPPKPRASPGAPPSN